MPALSKPRNKLNEARHLLTGLSVSVQRRENLEHLMREVAELADTDGLIGYNLGRFRILAHTI
jgi:hypothetical protein